MNFVGWTQILELMILNKFQEYLLANTTFMNNIKMSAKKKPAQEGDSIFNSIATGDR